MRLFIAINFNDAIKDKITALQDYFKSKNIKGNYSKRENLHLTLLFLGEIEKGKIESIKSAIQSINISPFEIYMNGTGCFKGREKSDTVFVNISKNENLEIINKFLKSELKKKGFEIKEQELIPHLTIIREASDNIVYGKTDVIKVQADRISLMLSERIKGELIYSEIYHKDLGVKND